MNEYAKKNLISWMLNISTALCLFIIMANSQGLFHAVGVQLIMRKLSDCFLIPGAVFGGVGSLCWIAAKGNFDMLGYGAKLCLDWLLHPTQKRYESFYEYKVRQEEKNPTGAWPWRTFVVGIVCIAFSVIFAILFEVVA